YIAGFIPLGRTTSDLPRILIQYQRWPEEPVCYEQLEAALQDGLPSAMKKVEDSLPLKLQSLGENMFYLDRTKNRMVIRLRAEVPGTGTVDGISFGMLGKSGAVLLHCYARKEKFTSTLPLFERFADSFKFDKGKEFVP